jgi:hypothetical protein
MHFLVDIDKSDRVRFGWFSENLSGQIQNFEILEKIATKIC